MTAAEMEYSSYLDEQMQIDDQFAVDDDTRAEWCCKKIAQAERNIANRKAFIDSEIERLQAWQRTLDARDQATIDHMTALLRPYFQSLRPSLGKRKSYSLPSGTLQVRASQPKFARDDDALVVWAETVDPEALVKVEKKPVWTEIKKRLRPVDNRPGAAVVDTKTGEIVDGVTVAEVAGETFSVKVEVQA